MSKKKFPTLAAILLAVGIIWLLTELNIITINIPWIPIVLIIIAIGLITNRYMGKWSHKIQRIFGPENQLVFWD